MEPLGTIWNYLERPKGNWNSRRLLERAKRIWNAPGSGTPALRLLERRAAPYPYSKMCELCELCELFVKNPTALAMGLASLINIYVCEIVYLFQDQTFYLAAIVGEEAIGIPCDYSSNAVSNPS